VQFKMAVCHYCTRARKQVAKGLPEVTFKTWQHTSRSREFSMNCDTYLLRGHLAGTDPLPVIEIDIEFEELEQKTAPQSDTTYLERPVYCP
jgi:hypothetical protein